MYFGKKGEVLVYVAGVLALLTPLFFSAYMDGDDGMLLGASIANNIITLPEGEDPAPEFGDDNSSVSKLPSSPEEEANLNLPIGEENPELFNDTIPSPPSSEDSEGATPDDRLPEEEADLNLPIGEENPELFNDTIPSPPSSEDSEGATPNET